MFNRVKMDWIGCNFQFFHQIGLNSFLFCVESERKICFRSDPTATLFVNVFKKEFINAKNFKRFVKEKMVEVYMIIFAIIIEESSMNDHWKIQIVLNNNDNINQIFFEYSDVQNVFFEIKTNILFKHDSNDFVINTQNKEFSFGKIYNLSLLKLKILKKYITEQLNIKFIVPFKSPAGAPNLFVLKKMKAFIYVLIIKNWIL